MATTVAALNNGSGPKTLGEKGASEMATTHLIPSPYILKLHSIDFGPVVEKIISEPRMNPIFKMVYEGNLEAVQKALNDAQLRSRRATSKIESEGAFILPTLALCENNYRPYLTCAQISTSEVTVPISLLQLAILRRHNKIVQEILAFYRSNTVSEPALIDRALCSSTIIGNTDAMRMLLEQGADPVRCRNRFLDDGTESPLYWALLCRHNDAAKLLIARGGGALVFSDFRQSLLLLDWAVMATVDDNAIDSETINLNAEMVCFILQQYRERFAQSGSIADYERHVFQIAIRLKKNSVIRYLASSSPASCFLVARDLTYDNDGLRKINELMDILRPISVCVTFVERLQKLVVDSSTLLAAQVGGFARATVQGEVAVKTESDKSSYERRKELQTLLQADTVVLEGVRAKQIEERRKNSRDSVRIAKDSLDVAVYTGNIDAIHKMLTSNRQEIELRFSEDQNTSNGDLEYILRQTVFQNRIDIFMLFLHFVRNMNTLSSIQQLSIKVGESEIFDLILLDNGEKEIREQHVREAFLKILKILSQPMPDPEMWFTRREPLILMIRHLMQRYPAVGEGVFYTLLGKNIQEAMSILLSTIRYSLAIIDSAVYRDMLQMAQVLNPQNDTSAHVISNANFYFGPDVIAKLNIENERVEKLTERTLVEQLTLSMLISRALDTTSHTKEKVDGETLHQRMSQALARYRPMQNSRNFVFLHLSSFSIKTEAGNIRISDRVLKFSPKGFVIFVKTWAEQIPPQMSSSIAEREVREKNIRGKLRELISTRILQQDKMVKEAVEQYRKNSADADRKARIAAIESQWQNNKKDFDELATVLDNLEDVFLMRFQIVDLIRVVNSYNQSLDNSIPGDGSTRSATDRLKKTYRTDIANNNLMQQSLDNRYGEIRKLSTEVLRLRDICRKKFDEQDIAIKHLLSQGELDGAEKRANELSNGIDDDMKKYKEEIEKLRRGSQSIMDTLTSLKSRRKKIEDESGTKIIKDVSSWRRLIEKQKEEVHVLLQIKALNDLNTKHEQEVKRQKESAERRAQRETEQARQAEILKRREEKAKAMVEAKKRKEDEEKKAKEEALISKQKAVAEAKKQKEDYERKSKAQALRDLKVVEFKVVDDFGIPPTTTREKNNERSRGLATNVISERMRRLSPAELKRFNEEEKLKQDCDRLKKLVESLNWDNEQDFSSKRGKEAEEQRRRQRMTRLVERNALLYVMAYAMDRIFEMQGISAFPAETARKIRNYIFHAYGRKRLLSLTRTDSDNLRGLILEVLIYLQASLTVEGASADEAALLTRIRSPLFREMLRELGTPSLRECERQIEFTLEDLKEYEDCLRNLELLEAARNFTKARRGAFSADIRDNYRREFGENEEEYQRYIAEGCFVRHSVKGDEEERKKREASLQAGGQCLLEDPPLLFSVTSNVSVTHSNAMGNRNLSAWEQLCLMAETRMAATASSSGDETRMSSETAATAGAGARAAR